MTGTTEGSISLIFELRGYLVMLSSDVAKIFDVETRLLNQNIKSNNKHHLPLFPEKYAFQLTEEETENLRSLGMMSSFKHGGNRVPPWLVTRKGAIRLATILKSPKAMLAADIFVDIFDEVISGLQKGNKHISVSNPSRLLPDEAYEKQINSIRKKIAMSLMIF
ncbi:MAG: ORF6N domain-containing protein [Candidatus Neomarinimicrobiota bacterium]